MTHSDVSDYSSLLPTNLKLNDKLVADAVELGGFKTKQAAVNAALAEFVGRRNRRRLLELAGQIDFDPAWDYKRMRGRR